MVSLRVYGLITSLCPLAISSAVCTALIMTGVRPMGGHACMYVDECAYERHASTCTRSVEARGIYISNPLSSQH